MNWFWFVCGVAVGAYLDAMISGMLRERAQFRREEASDADRDRERTG